MAAGESRRPRARFLIDGQELTGLLEVEIEHNGYQDADRFDASFVLSDLPKSFGFPYWAKTDDARVEILMGVSEPRKVLVAEVDDVSIDPISNSLHLSGRDLSARLIETVTENKNPNLKSSKLAEKFAAEHGLKVVAPASETLVGTHYGDDQSMLSTGRTQWDVLTYVAQQEGRRVFVEGDTLYFVKHDDMSGALFVLRFDGSVGAPITEVTSVRFGRALTVAKDVTVKVRSWHNEEKKGYTKTASAQHRSPRKKGQTFSVTVPNLTPEQAQARAEAMLKDVTHSEVTLEFSGPASDDLTLQGHIRVEGTKSGFDQVYFPDIITRRWSWDGGYVWDVTAKNHSPHDTVLG